MTDPRSAMPGVPPSLIDRIKNLLMTPKTEWPKIDAEPATVQGLFTGYVLLLAAIGPIAIIIGQQVFGIYGVKPSLQFTLTSAVLTYVLSIVSVYVNGLIIDALAPSFGGTKDSLKAMKVAAYAPTAAWLAGAFQIVPMLAVLGIVGLYSLYLLYLGAPLLMRVAQDKALVFTIVVIVVQVVIYAICLSVVGMLVLSIAGPVIVAPTMVRY
jgi:hypothetical protein